MIRLNGILVFVAFVAGCLGEKDCVPHSEACINDVARTCSSTGHGYAASGLPLVRCAASGAVCVVEQGRARCAPVDGGVVAVVAVDAAISNDSDAATSAPGDASDGSGAP